MTAQGPDTLRLALAQFDAAAFVKRHGGHKESASPHSFEWLLGCPKCHGDRLRWNSAKQMFTCWGCSTPTRVVGGSTIDLICLLEGVDIGGALAILHAGFVGGGNKLDTLDGSALSTRDPRLGGPVLRQPKAVQWPPEGCDLLTVPCVPHARAWQYLASRGVTAAMVQEAGLAFGRTGKLANYVVFPVRMDGRVVYWQGRATWDPPLGLTREQRKAWVDDTKYRKTMNPTARTPEDTTAQEVLLGYDAARSHRHVVVVEGPFDQIKIGPHGVAMLGKAVSPQKVALLQRLRVDRYTIYLDRGAEEMQWAEHLAAQLYSHAPVHVAVPPEGRDPGSLARHENAAIVQAAPRWRAGMLTSGL